MKNIVVLVSGGGTNLQALIDAQKNGQIPLPEKLDQQYDKVSIERALTTVKILRIERQHIEITIGTVIDQTPGVISKSSFVYM